MLIILFFKAFPVLSKFSLLNEQVFNFGKNNSEKGKKENSP